MKFDAIIPMFRDPKTRQVIGELFGDVQKIQAKYGKDLHGAVVSAELDRCETAMQKGMVYYDGKGNILHDRSALLAELQQNHKIYKPAGGMIQGKPS